ncbi:MAG TPA: type VII secretion target [Longimicrobiaceae bacterium]|nr:type VII secretion target [Longimicrobiaceae bacterium]
MAGGYEVITEALVTHATSLGRIADQLGTALDAANTVSMPRDAYGVICQFFPPMIDPIEQAGVSAIQQGVTSMNESVTAVNTTAREYDAVETTNAQSFGGN